MIYNIKQTEQEFFSDKENLQARFNEFADLIQPYYSFVSLSIPQSREIVLSKLMRAKVRVGHCEKQSDRDVCLPLGKTLSNVKGEPYLDEGVYLPYSELISLQYTRPEVVVKCGDKVIVFFSEIDNILDRPPWIISETNHTQDAFLHGLTHYLEDRREYTIFKNPRPLTPNGVIQEAQIESQGECGISEIRGGELVRHFEAQNGQKIRLISESKSSKLCEEAMIDFVVDAVKCETGLIDYTLGGYFMTNDIHHKPFVYLTGMWNLVSGNELIRVLFEGLDNASKSTLQYNDLLNMLARHCPTEKSKDDKFSQHLFDCDCVTFNIAQMVAMADNQVSKLKLSPDAANLYRFYRQQVLNPEIMIDYIKECSSDFKEEEMVAKQLKKRYSANSRRVKKQMKEMTA